MSADGEAGGSEPAEGASAEDVDAYILDMLNQLAVLAERRGRRELAGWIRDAAEAAARPERP